MTARFGDAAKPTTEKSHVPQVRHHRARHRARRTQARPSSRPSDFDKVARAHQGPDRRQVITRRLRRGVSASSRLSPRQGATPARRGSSPRTSDATPGTDARRSRRDFRRSPAFARALVGVRIESLSRDDAPLRAQQRQARRPRVEHEAADDGGRRGAAGLGLPLRDAARGGWHHRQRRAPRRPHRHRRRRSVDRVAGSWPRPPLFGEWADALARRPASAASTAASSATTTRSTMTASARDGRGTT